MAQEEKTYQLTKKQIAEFVVLGLIIEKSANSDKISEDLILGSIRAAIKDLDKREDSELPDSAGKTLTKILNIINDV